MPPKTKDGRRTTPFQRSHELCYGFRVAERDAKSNAVVSVACHFCEVYYREEISRVGSKRARTARLKFFKQPF
eukprot:IDg6463t1